MTAFCWILVVRQVVMDLRVDDHEVAEVVSESGPALPADSSE